MAEEGLSHPVAGPEKATPPTILASESGYLDSANEVFHSPKDADEKYEKADSKTPHWNANSYFAPKQSDWHTSAEHPDSPTEVAKGARTGAELLRRLSLVNSVSQPESMDIDPRTSHPGLRLTGNVISATVCIPYSVGMRFGGEWEVKARRGTSALFDSFSHLSSSRTPWNHTLVAWTVEI